MEVQFAMAQHLQPLDDVLALAAEFALTPAQLRCEMSRQQSSGVHVRDNGARVPISYDMILCKHCGNLPGVKVYCPAKVKALRSRKLAEHGER